MNMKGLRVAELEAGDLLCFPGQFYHEVHNLTPSSTAITNASIWPEDEKNGKNEEKLIPGRKKK